MSYGSDWTCKCGWANLDVRSKCRHCGEANPEAAPAPTGPAVTEMTDDGEAAWRAVAHPETGMGAMIHPIKRFLIQDADGIYGEGKWELQALVVRSSASDTAYNVNEAHMFGPPEDPVDLANPSEARARAAEAASLAKDEKTREAHAFIAKLVRMQSGAGWTRAVVRDAAAEFLRSQGVAVEPYADTTPEMIARSTKEQP